MATIWKGCAVGACMMVVASCDSPSARISTELMRYGLDQRQSTCVGDRLEARLSIGQLQQLASAARAYSSNDPNPRQLRAGDLARASAQINDPQVPVEVASAAASCGVLAALLSGV